MEHVEAIVRKAVQEQLTAKGWIMEEQPAYEGECFKKRVEASPIMWRGGVELSPWHDVKMMQTTLQPPIPEAEMASIGTFCDQQLTGLGGEGFSLPVFQLSDQGYDMVFLLFIPTNNPE